MKEICRTIRETLSTSGPAALREDAAAQAHLAECDGCFEVLELQAELERAMALLPVADAPDELVDRVLAAAVAGEPDDVEAVAPVPHWRARGLAVVVGPFRGMAGSWRSFRSDPRWLRRSVRAAALGATAAIAVLVTLTVVVAPRNMKVGAEVVRDVAAAPAKVDEVRQLFSMRIQAPDDQGELGAFAEEESPKPSSPSPPPPPALAEGMGTLDRTAPRAEPEDAPAARDPWAILTQIPGVVVDRINVGGNESGQQSDFDGPGSGGDNVFEVDDVVITEMETRGSALTFYDSGQLRETQEAAGRSKGDKDARTDASGLSASLSANEPQPKVAGKMRELNRPIEQANRRIEPAEEKLARLKAKRQGARDEKSISEKEESDQEADAEREYGPSRQLAQELLAKQSELERIEFQEAEGYWSNAYVPGDPAFRLLQSRLVGQERDELERVAGQSLRLHENARQMAQPFDPPANAALAVYLHADHRGLESEGRVLLQVGLQATERRSGRRPALNLALVLDVTGEVSTDAAVAFRALVGALGEQRDLGDRFHLVVAGRPGGVVVEPDDFRHGPLAVALERLFGLGGSTASALDLPTAVATAVELVARDDDPNAPLGSSVVLLATARTLGSREVQVVSALAHRSAVSGVPLSAIGIGDRIDRTELDRIALAGQGNRRLLGAPIDASALVDRELTAVSRVVARALRLRIRLAPGARLVDILGSRRLDEGRAEEVREAERSIDERLARNLGIEADRGDDEEGIQVVIPAFYAGDAHVIVLDVVAPGPGPLADVTVRYKDLVYLRNGVARDHLELGRRVEPAGPLEVNVLKNLLAYRLFETLEAAGGLAEAGDREAAAARLRAFAELLRGLQEEVPGLAQDADIETDLAMLAEYAALIEAGDRVMPEAQRQLVDSMRYAARLKILPQPVGADQ